MFSFEELMLFGLSVVVSMRFGASTDILLDIRFFTFIFDCAGKVRDESLLLLRSVLLLRAMSSGTLYPH